MRDEGEKVGREEGRTQEGGGEEGSRRVEEGTAAS